MLHERKKDLESSRSRVSPYYLVDLSYFLNLSSFLTCKNMETLPTLQGCYEE